MGHIPAAGDGGGGGGGGGGCSGFGRLVGEESEEYEPREVFDDEMTEEW